MLILNENDMTNVVSSADMLTAIETALIIKENKDFLQPERMHADYNNGTLLLMPCFTPQVFGTKVISLFPGNVEKNIPVLNGLMILNEGGTGAPLALLNGSKLTALRTGAVGSVSIRHLTPENVTTLGIIGASVQGYHQALFAMSVRNFRRINLFDLSAERMNALKTKLATQFPETEIVLCNSTADLAENSAVIITATNAESPVLPDSQELLTGKHFVGIGSYKPFMREYPDALFKIVDTVFVDTEHAVTESGDLIDPLKKRLLDRKKVVTLGKLLSGEIEKDAYRVQTTFFKCVGMALFDLLAAQLIYEKAREKGVGREIEF